MELTEATGDSKSKDQTSSGGDKTNTTNLADEIQKDGLSKNQLKKLKKREKWLSIKQDVRRNAKLKRKNRLAEMRERGEDTGPTRKRLKSKTMKNSCCKIKIAIDLSLDEYMADKDVTSLTSQLQHSYAANRRATNPVQLYFCGLCGKTKERLDRIGDYKGWDIHSEPKMYDEAFRKEDIVYLSSESENILSTLSEDKVYVIGGLVDHNKQKGICHRLAEEKGISHAQLPISEFLEMKTRKVLTVNQVFAILVKYTETGDWKESFLSEMPQRKNASAKSSEGSLSKAEISEDANTTDKSGLQVEEKESDGENKNLNDNNEAKVKENFGESDNSQDSNGSENTEKCKDTSDGNGCR